MDKQYIIGIDIGTTNIKGAMYSSEGEQISSYNISYKSYSIKEGYHEQNPEDWVKGLISILQKLTTSENNRENLAGIAISTQGGTVVPVDKDYRPLTKAITWLDKRAVNLLKNDKKLLRKNIEFYTKTGWRLDTNMSFMPLYWLKEKKPKIFAKIHKVLYVNDYVYKKITGNNFQDHSNASMSLFYNIKTGNWDKDILKLLNFNEDNFSRIKDSGDTVGYLNNDICKKLNIKKKVKVINGGHDQHCAGLGAGILNNKEILLSTGTAWVIFKILTEPLLDSRRFFAIGRSVLDSRLFSLIYSIPSAGASLKWFVYNLMDLNTGEKLSDLINNNINKLLKIKNPILFYPYLTGAFGPDFDMDKKASFKNIEISHNNLDFIKAIMEGVGFQLKKIFTVFEEKGIKIKKIKMVGGATKSILWPQIVSDITCTEILIPESNNEDIASRGAAILAGYGAGIFSSPKEGYSKLKPNFKILRPDKKMHDYYEDKMRKFLNS